MPNIVNTVKPASIYLSLFASQFPRDDAYVWGIYVSCAQGDRGTLFRATAQPNNSPFPDISPRLFFESKEYDLYEDPDLFLLLELGALGERRTVREIHAILEKVAIPAPEEEYSYLFNGRTWVIKAIMRLSAYGIIRSRRLERMEDDIQVIAAEAFDGHVQGHGWTVTKFIDRYATSCYCVSILTVTSSTSSEEGGRGSDSVSIRMP